VSGILGFTPFVPSGIALTKDGRYAYLSFDVSAYVVKVRLSDMTVVAGADFTRYYPLRCARIVLDATETKLFLYDHVLGRLLVLDAASLLEIRMIGGFSRGVSQLVLSRWGPYLFLINGSGWQLNTDTLELTALGYSRGFMFIQESVTDPTLWYGVASTPQSTLVGTYDYKKALWSPKVTLRAQAPDWSVHDFAVLPDGSKAYLGVLGSWLPNYQTSGWLYAADLQNGAVKELPIDGGILALTLNKEASRLYAGTGWPARVNDAVAMIHVIDTSGDTDIGVVNIGVQKFHTFCTQLNEMKIDPVNGGLLYATNADGNSFTKVDLATSQVIDNLVLNDETNSPHMFLRIPGTSRAYALLSRTSEALEIDLDRAEVVRTVKFPLTRTDFLRFGAAFRDAGTLLVAQGEYFMELAADLTLRAKRSLPKGTPSIWSVLGSGDGKTLYSVANSQSQSDTFLALDSTTFQIKASLHLDGGSFALPWEHPNAGKLYVVGGTSNPDVFVHVIDAQSLSLLKTIRFNDPQLGGIATSGSYPYAYDPATHTLFAASNLAILAIDTDRDEIRRVIPNAAIYDFRTSSANGLAFNPAENRLYLAHGDGALISVYDFNADHFLPQLFSTRGYAPGWALANSDVSKFWVANTGSDNLTVFDTKTLTLEKVIDIHACNPLPGSLQFEAGGETTKRITLSALTTTSACSPSITTEWLSVAPVQGAGPQTFDVSVNPPAFGPGTYKAAVGFQSTARAQSSLDVSLKVGSGISSVRIASVADATGAAPVLTPGSWAAVSGGNLSPATRWWQAEDMAGGSLPAALAGTGVTVNGRNGALSFVSPSEVIFQVPNDLPDGTVAVQVSNNGALSNSFSATLRQRAPELFRFVPSPYVTALHTNFRIAAKPALFLACTDAVLCPASEASPGETIILYGAGFGATTPPAPAGKEISTPVPLASSVEVRFGNVAVNASGWLVGPGLYQINVKVPDSQQDGDVPLVVAIGGATSSATAQLTVRWR
jgi:uncharacterized protein (TIGR03437 family)